MDTAEQQESFCTTSIPNLWDRKDFDCFPVAISRFLKAANGFVGVFLIYKEICRKRIQI